MKKKTAITLGALALLATGVTFGGFKIKEKKEKDKIEKTLKTVLIPNAEKELDKLLQQNSDLSDSIVLYNQLLLRQSAEADGQRLLQTYNKNFGMANTNMYQDINELISLLKSMQKDWEKEFHKVEKQWSNKYIGDGEYDYDNISKTVKDYTTYLKSGIMKNLYKVDSFYIPGKYKQYYASGMYNDMYLGDHFPMELEYYEYGPNGYDYRDLLQSLQYALKSTKGGFTVAGTNGNKVFYQITSGTEIKQILIAVQAVLDNTDNSKKIINTETLKTAKSVVKKLLISIEKQIKLEKQRDDTSAKLDGFKNAKKQLETKIDTKQKELKNYKSPDIVNRMYKGQRKK